MSTIKDVGVGPWRRGMPKKAGWYNASSSKQKHVLRWCDSRHWYLPALPSHNAAEAMRSASIRVSKALEDSILWRPLKPELRRGGGNG